MKTTATRDLAPEVRDRLERIWKRAYAARTDEDLAELYENWSDTYDEDHEAIGFFAHHRAASELGRYLPNRKVSAILDAGSGTGAAGEALHAIGYRNLTAVDLSDDMLERARSKNLYQHLFQANLGEPLDLFPRDHFDAAILVGVFSYGQAPAIALDEIVRVVKPGGIVTFTMRVDFFEQDAMGVRSRMEELELTHAWKNLAVTESEAYLPKKDPTAKFRVWTYRVLETKTPPVHEEFAAAVRHAFMTRSPVKRIDHSFIWNSTASRLYDQYTLCEDYYLTDSEVEILEAHAREILGDDRLIIELGCGSARKIGCLLQALPEHEIEKTTYTPIDVSQGALEATKAELDQVFADRVDIEPRCGRFLDILASIPAKRSKLVLFFGGSLGNIETLEETVEFLHALRDRMAPGDRLVVGIDLHKDVEVLRRAYEAGHANRLFFLNMVRRMNHELGANFDLGAFQQHSPYEADEPYEGIETRCVQLRLTTDRPQHAYISAMHMEVALREGDAVQVGTSRKFSLDAIARLAELAELRLGRQWFDAKEYFSLNEFVNDGTPRR
ncbi:MAG: L-histidine N(alpha)-methyltransferase [Planctomycetes bacterium]|nr:L-histidine N(alpha)-methyltransferase [Planctomycetota bacterium]MCB9890910.1 L-histidine N(alpha)-methyltransferase [Planctomycetota bacterium]